MDFDFVTPIFGSSRNFTGGGCVVSSEHAWAACMVLADGGALSLSVIFSKPKVKPILKTNYANWRQVYYYTVLMGFKKKSTTK